MSDVGKLILYSTLCTIIVNKPTKACRKVIHLGQAYPATIVLCYPSHYAAAVDSHSSNTLKTLTLINMNYFAHKPTPN